MPDKWTPECLIEINGLVKRALDPADPDPNEAAVDAFCMMRRYGLGIECINAVGYGEPATKPKRAKETTSSDLPKIPSSDVVIAFGKHKDKRLGDILVADSGYFWWLANKADIQSPDLAEAIEDLWDRRSEFGVD